MASPGISPGMKAHKQTFVCEHNVAPHVNKFSTPAMIQLMEQASSEVVGDNLEEGDHHRPRRADRDRPQPPDLQG
jgi:hypothetical protein